MRLFRYACAGLATSVLAASAFTGPASAQAAGVGTSLTSTKLLTAQLGEAGSILDLALLTDEARSTIDSAVASPEAFTRLTALAAKASLVPGSPVNVTEGVFEAKSTGPSEVPIAGSTLAVPASVPAPLSPVLSGTIDPGKLTATLNQGVAASTMATKVSQVKAVGGLLGIGTLQSVLDASSGATASGASRSASVGDVTVLDLGALLQGLGLPLGELTPETLAALVDSLGVTQQLGLPSGSTTLAGAVDQLNAAVDDLQATLDAAPANAAAITSAIDGTTSTVLGAVGGATGVVLPVPTVGQTLDEAIATVNALIDEVQALLNDLLAEGLAALDGLALLRLEGVEVGVVTKAVDSVEGSVASVTGKIGAVKVGNLQLPGIDLAGTAAQVTSALAAVNTQLGTVLAAIDPALANVVKVSVLDQATSIVQEGGYTKSRAGVTAATASITPPADLAGLVTKLLAGTSVLEELAPTAATIPVPALDGLMGQLQGTLGLATSALASPAKVQIASVLSASDFRIAGAPATPGAPTGGGGSPSLPRTGGPDLVLLGGLLAIVALAVRRLSRTPQVLPIEVERH